MFSEKVHVLNASLNLRFNYYVIFAPGDRGVNPTIMIYNATSSLVRFENKKYILRQKRLLPITTLAL
jgi:hypothetical protein